MIEVDFRSERSDPGEVLAEVVARVMEAVVMQPQDHLREIFEGLLVAAFNDLLRPDAAHFDDVPLHGGECPYRDGDAAAVCTCDPGQIAAYWKLRWMRCKAILRAWRENACEEHAGAVRAIHDELQRHYRPVVHAMRKADSTAWAEIERLVAEDHVDEEVPAEASSEDQAAAG